MWRSLTPGSTLHGAGTLELSVKSLAGKTLGTSFNISLTSSAQESPHLRPGLTQEPNSRNGNLGWKTWSLSPGDGPNIPARVTVQLRFTTGPLERVKENAPDFSGMMSLEGDGQLNGLGQTVEGKAFVAFSVMSSQMQSRTMSAQILTRDGRELSGSRQTSERSDGKGLRVERYEFDVPLSDVAKFIIGTRPIRTNEWKNVVLPGN